MIRKKRNRARWVVIAVAVAAFCVAAFWQGLTVRDYTVINEKITAPLRLAVLTDLHDTLYGEGQIDLLEAIRRQGPDLVLLVGDIADDEGSHAPSEQLLSALDGEYPCYYVTGNHEYWSGEADQLKEMIRSYGVTVLEGDTQIVRVGGQEIRICGVDDPDGFRSPYSAERNQGKSWGTQLDTCRAETGDGRFTVLLSHRPELTERYRDSGFDLVVSGHAHGGQVRIPGLLNGLYSPDQGFFPAYAGGRYQLGETVLLVSRGLSKSRIPRVFNPPELVMVELEPLQ